MTDHRETTATIEELRASGFTSEALAYSRDQVALRLLCAFFNGVNWKTAPPGWWSHPNESTRAAWQRVADEAKAIYQEQIGAAIKSIEGNGVTNG